MASANRTLHDGWSFTQVGHGAKDAVKEGEWIPVQAFPTTVHVELLKAGRIPDPVSCVTRRSEVLRLVWSGCSSSGCKNGMCNVRAWIGHDLEG